MKWQAGLVLFLGVVIGLACWIASYTLATFIPSLSWLLRTGVVIGILFGFLTGICICGN